MSGGRGHHTGDRIGRYALVTLLGRGGSGDVWEAELLGPHGFRRPIALKLLAGTPSADAHDGLFAEARLGARMQHPNVVSTFELGQAGGVWFVAMELVKGATVRDLVRAGEVPAHSLLEVAIQVCEGLSHVHGLLVDGEPAGVVHRDIKPSNLLIAATGLVKIADLGIARFRGQGNERAGTPGYMAPEQVRGELEDARTDLFALGVTMCAMATRKRPFGGGAEAAHRILRVEELLRPELLGPVEAAVPGLGEVVRRCLRGRREDRYPTAAALATDLRALLGRQQPGLPLVALLQRTSGDPTASAPVPQSGSATLKVRRGNLVTPRRGVHGREALVEEVAARVLGGTRLQTLLAIGGMGKTTVALAVARRAQEHLQGGCWFVDASDARTIEGLCIATARALGVAIVGDPATAVGAALAQLGRALLVLDNLEQAEEAGPAVVARWEQAAPDVALLCTSRTALRLSGEVRVPVGPLSVDDGLAMLAERAPRPLRADERASAQALVGLLEGMPLAIELAAARLRLLSTDDVLRRASQGLRLLAGGAVDTPERHRSIRASLAGSWELLAPHERAAMSQLAVFEGGFTLEASEAVLDLDAFPDAGWAMDVLEVLADASLLQVAGERFTMMRLVHDYAIEQTDPATRAASELRHGRFFAQAGTDRALLALTRHGAARRHQELLRDLDNLLAAVRRAVARGDAEIAGCTARAAAWLLDVRGPVEMGERLLLDVMELPGLDPRVRGVLLGTAGWAAQRLGRSEVALERYLSALEWTRASEDRGLEAVALGSVGMIHRDAGRRVEARAMFESAIALHRAAGNANGEATVLANLGLLELDGEGPEVARRCFERALELHRQIGNDRLEGVVLGNLGLLHGKLGDYERAIAYLEQALATHHRVGNRGSEAIELGNLGVATWRVGRVDEARALLERSVELHREVGNLPFVPRVLDSLVILELAQGDLVRASRVADQAIQATAPLPAAFGGKARIRRALVAARCGEGEAGCQLALQGLEQLRAAGDPQALALGLALAAQVHHFAARAEPAARLLAEARDLVRGEGCGPRTEARQAIADADGLVGPVAG